MVEGQPILRSETLAALAIDTDFFTDLTFTGDTPNNFARKLTIQLNMTTALVFKITLDGTTFTEVNNAVAVTGLFVFDVWVENTETFNIQTSTGTATGTVKVFG